MEEPIVESYEDEIVESSTTEEGVTEPTQEEVQTEASEGAEEVETEQEEVVEPQNNQTIPKERFREVYWKMKENERKLQEYEAKLQELNTQKPQEGGVKVNKEPTLEDFDYDSDAYTAALIDYRVNSKLEEYSSSLKQKEAQMKQQQVLDTFRSKAAQYAAKNPEYSKANQAALYQPVASHVEEAVITSDVGPELHHYLLDNPDVLDRLNSASPISAAREIGKIELSLTTKVNKKTISSAPAPIETVTPSASVSNPLYDEKLDMEAFYAEVMKRR